MHFADHSGVDRIAAGLRLFWSPLLVGDSTRFLTLVSVFIYLIIQLPFAHECSSV